MDSDLNGKWQKADGRRIHTAKFRSAYTPVVRRLTYCLLLSVYCLLALSGCNKPFEPFKENDMYAFTIYGYLDASADTQWVRVAPARQDLNMSSDISDIRVTLEHPESGDSIVMNDSIFASGDGFNFLNFWTTMDIEYEQIYRLKAERPDGQTSQVSVTIPRELPTPRVLIQANFGQPTTYSVYIDDSVEHLIDVQTRWYVRFFKPGFETKKLFSFSYKNEAEQIPAYNGVYSIFLEPELEEEEIVDQSQALLNSGAEMEILDRQIFVASAGPEWNENIESLDDVTYTLPNSFSNVENGLGYMFGVSSKTVPYESCFTDEGLLIPCEEEKPYW